MSDIEQLSVCKIFFGDPVSGFRKYSQLRYRPEHDKYACVIMSCVFEILVDIFDRGDNSFNYHFLNKLVCMNKISKSLLNTSVLTPLCAWTTAKNTKRENSFSIFLNWTISFKYETNVIYFLRYKFIFQHSKLIIYFIAK